MSPQSSLSDFWNCNKTTALMKSAELSHRMDQNIRNVLNRDDLTPHQKREIAETLSIPATYEIEISEAIDLNTD